MAEDEGLDSLSNDRHSGCRSWPFGVAGDRKSSRIINRADTDVVSRGENRGKC